MTVLAQEPVPDDLLPFGWVDCGVIDVVGDDTSDDDQDPGSVPVVGDGLIVFIPKITEMRVMRNGRSTLVRNRPVPANLDQDGVIELAGHRLVKLWHGVWTCTPGNRNILDFDQFDFELTGDYTTSSPLPLWHIAPYVPPDGVTVTTMEVPSGQQPGETLAWDGSQLAWVTPKVTPSVSTLPANSNATASFTGQWPNLTLALGLPRGADGQPTQYQIVGAGRPDVTTSMDATTQAAVTSATVGTTFISTDGPQGAWAWRRRTTGWQVIDGDTGWRRLYSESPASWASYASGIAGLDVRRAGSTMYARIYGSGPNQTWSTLKVSNKIEQPLTSAMPAGMAPLGRLWAPMMLDGVYTGGVLIKSSSWFLSVTGATQNDQLVSADIQWPVMSTDSAWPTTLPGTTA